MTVFEFSDADANVALRLTGCLRSIDGFSAPPFEVRVADEVEAIIFRSLLRHLRIEFTCASPSPAHLLHRERRLTFAPNCSASEGGR